MKCLLKKSFSLPGGISAKGNALDVLITVYYFHCLSIYSNTYSKLIKMRDSFQLAFSLFFPSRNL